MIAKSHKDPRLPTSYRPIALLCPIAKILEKLFAVRLTRRLLNSGVLPFEQYGCQGRNTNQALESLINAAYNGWTDGDKDRHVSIYALDVKGAFDRVRRAHLLRILREYGVPDWMIMFVWSFLSDRSTTVRPHAGSSVEEVLGEHRHPARKPAVPHSLSLLLDPSAQQAHKGERIGL
ncbi:hypothetical protein CCHR01_14231 [Colletotrichum chrysophilum]|uniref:Reverse transcriptase domain-containing protein n=1 Tax=Colletotrichum chrysophilum TaxID=1836956 RepID=A0AAD9A8X6_9PEZI|nr:hypothetical protein CCHR01_14231 [Colletotrichum chrysophilum]